MNNLIYLDNNATTQVDKRVLDEMLPFFHDYYWNPSSMYSPAGEVAQNLRIARRRIGKLLGATPDEIIFTSCGTESDSTAVYAALAALPEKKHIVTTRVEHPAIMNLYADLETKGYSVTYVPVNREGALDMRVLEESLTEETAIVSIMWANNESGVIFPVERIAEMTAEKGILFHTDAVQAAGKIPIDLSRTRIDMLSISGHKIHAPKGVGALYVRKGLKYSPFLLGGHQEGGRRGGTENVASIVGFGKAGELALEHLEEENTRVKALRDRLERGLTQRIPKAIINGESEPRLPNTSSISFEYVEGEAILLMMDELGICASSGSACTSGSLEPSHVLRAMGIPFTAAHGTIRFSFSIFNTEEEVDFVVEKLPPIIEKLREMSPFWEG